MRRWLFSLCLVVFFLLGLGGAIPTILSPTLCRGSESGEDPFVFSLDVKDEPLGEVLKKISKATGYEITINTEYTKIPITAQLRGVGVEEGLNRVLKDFNRALVVIDTEKKISINVYGFSSGTRPFMTLPMEGKNNQAVQQQEIDPRDFEVIPPEHPGERGITQAEIDAKRALRGKIDPLDLEVIPPDRPGERGLTRREIEAARHSSKHESSPQDAEVIPPEHPGERGITQAEIDAKRALRGKIDPLDLEVIPPDRPGERGLTRREIEAARHSSKHESSPQDAELIPPDSDPERGINSRGLDNK